MHLTPGSRVERYVVEHPLGQGGMATVYAVRHALLGSRHALKVLHSTNPMLHERLILEGRVQAQLDPEHVVPVQDVLLVGGAPALLMPLVQGCSLQQLLEAHRPSEAEAAALFEAIVAGVASAHEAGVVHRDLKPGNVLLDEKRGRVRVRVADFGLARTGDDPLQTRAGAVMGTPAYAAPEQMRDTASADHRADMWSLGVVLLELLTGTRPASPSADDRADSLAGLPLAWRAIVDALLVDDPASRWESAQQLLEQVRRVAVPDRLASHGPVAAAVRRHGERVVAPSPVLEADDHTLDLESLPAAPVDRSHHLPAERDRFIGRADALNELHERLGQGRLVTVTGTGGAGKTRLVSRYARREQQQWAGGVWFCDLSEAQTQQGILHAVARTLDVPLGPDPDNQLAHAIAGRGPCLVVLDNFEQVQAHAEATVGGWLGRAPQARFVVTSRQRLGLSGELVMALPPLATAEAEALFVARASQARSGFTPSPEERAAIHELVALLDQLPLAIELAAARVGILPPKKLLARMADRFRLLAAVGGSRTDRHATLRSTLDWSWGLLTPWEQSALAQLSVFDGGFDLEAAEFVVDLTSFADAPWAMDAVQSLLEKSLVRRVSDERFDLLRSVRDYAADKLDEPAGPERRHVEHYARSGSDEARDALRGPDGIAERRRHVLELDNLIVATRRAIAQGRGAAAVATCRAAWWHFDLQGPLATGRALAEAVLGMEGLSGQQRAHMLLIAGSVCLRSGQPDVAQRHFDEALRLAQGEGARRVEAEAQRQLGELHASCGRLGDAAMAFQEALEAHRAAADRHGEAYALGRMHMCLHRQGRHDEALAHLQQSLALARGLGDQRQEAMAQCNLGVHRLTEGFPDEALANYQAALPIARATRSRFHEARLLSNLGVLFIREGKVDEAEQSYGEALALAQRMGERPMESLVLLNRGEVDLARGDVDEARTQFEASLRVQRDLRDRRIEVELLHHLGRLASERGDDGAVGLLERALASTRESGDRGAQGRVLGSLGEHWGRRGRPGDARSCFAEGEALLRAVGDPEPLAGLLCQQIPVEMHSGDPQRARALLDEAVGLATAADLLAEPFFGQRLARARRAVRAGSHATE